MPTTQVVPVASTRAYEVTAPDSAYVTVQNLGPDSCYYAAASTVSSGSNDGTLASGGSLFFQPSKFFISAGTSRLQLTVQGATEFVWQDCTLGGSASVTAGFNATLQAARGANGFIYMRGVITMSAGVASGVTVFTLPPLCKPLTKRLVAISGSGNTGYQVAVATDGTVAPGTTAWAISQVIGFDGTSFPI